MKHRKTYFILILLASCIFLSFRNSHAPIKKLKKIAKEYEQYRLHFESTPVKDTANYLKWTITLCKRRCYCKEQSAFVSNADASVSPHGNKLYKLYVKDYESYARNAPEGQPVGQVLVKETWNVEEIVYDSSKWFIQQVQSKNDGKWYTPTTVSELFIMYKEEESAENDKGWNYGTVSMESKREKPMLLNDMKISTCISCHKDTKYDRIFGLR